MASLRLDETAFRAALGLRPGGTESQDLLPEICDNARILRGCRSLVYQCRHNLHIITDAIEWLLHMCKAADAVDCDIFRGMCSHTQDAISTMQNAVGMLQEHAAHIVWSSKDTRLAHTVSLDILMNPAFIRNSQATSYTPEAHRMLVIITRRFSADYTHAVIDSFDARLNYAFPDFIEALAYKGWPARVLLSQIAVYRARVASIVAILEAVHDTFPPQWPIIRNESDRAMHEAGARIIRQQHEWPRFVRALVNATHSVSPLHTSEARLVEHAAFSLAAAQNDLSAADDIADFVRSLQ